MIGVVPVVVTSLPSPPVTFAGTSRMAVLDAFDVSSRPVFVHPGPVDNLVIPFGFQIAMAVASRATGSSIRRKGRLALG
jgi:dolichol kinase